MSHSHPEKFRVIGFCDASFKWHGTWQTTRFREEDCFVSEHIPTQDSLRAYAIQKGYWPSKTRGSTLTKCEPVYYVIGDSQELIGPSLKYAQCKECFPGNEVIDNLGVSSG